VTALATAEPLGAKAVEAAAGPPPRAAKRAGPLEWILVHLVFLVVCAFFLVPFLWLLSAAFDGKASAYIQFPVQPTIMNFVRIFTEHDFARVLANSVFVAVATMILVVVAVSLAGYSLSRIDIRRKDWITYAVLLLQTMPISATMVPIYGLAKQLGLRNSYLGLILIHAAIELPFLIWLMKGFFDSIPNELDESARVDGATPAQVFWGIILPLGAPVLAVVGLLSFIATMNEYIIASRLLQSTDNFTLPVGMYGFISDQYGQRWGPFCAGVVLAAIPVIVIFLFLQRFIVHGLTSGSVKG
jgi:arabinogalactan oligomer/maltooligosaccharide transport system permease protein